MAITFWDARDIIQIGYLQSGRGLNSEYYGYLLDRINADLKKKFFSSKTIEGAHVSNGYGEIY